MLVKLAFVMLNHHCAFRLFYHDLSNDRDETIEQAEADVAEANQDLKTAKAKEASDREDLALRIEFDEGTRTPETPEEIVLAGKPIKDLEKLVKARGKVRRKCQKELEDRRKLRDTAVERLHTESAVKKNNQIYCDNGTYTARWTHLPS